MSNVLSKEKRVQVIRCLIEGNSIRSTERITGVYKQAITRLLRLMGNACSEFEHATLQNLTCKRIQCDEIWAFVGCKEQHLPHAERGKGRGDVWTWTAIDPDTKLIAAWHVGLREAADSIEFMETLASRLANRIQLTTDGHKGYFGAIDAAFGCDVDFGQAIKVYHHPLDNGRIEARYSPSRCKEVKRIAITGNPDPDHISTSHNERHNLTMRMQMRRFTRLTNAFSKKMENHAHAVALHMAHYNFCRVHQSLRVTPAMAAGIADHVWTLEELVGLIDRQEQAAA